MNILITGTAGFIGFHLVKRLINEGHQITGLDMINDYYDVNLKYARLAETGIVRESIEYNKIVQSNRYQNYRFIQLKLEDKEAIFSLFKSEKFDLVCNLAAQAGVRYSLTNPDTYISSNISGFLNILEACRHFPVQHLCYASSSSVYGLNGSQPFSTKQTVEHPISLYATSKKCNELMAHTYSQLFNIPTTGLRFFTVYGPWGRPDMALFIFTKAILEGKSIDVYNNGDMQRDFTYVADIVEGIRRVMFRTPKANKNWNANDPDPSSSMAPYKIYNIGNNNPVKLMDFIDAIEAETGKKAIKNLLPLQIGDVPATWADVSELINDTGFKPETSINQGIKEFMEWYINYYSIK